MRIQEYNRLNNNNNNNNKEMIIMWNMMPIN